MTQLLRTLSGYQLSIKCNFRFRSVDRINIFVSEISKIYICDIFIRDTN